MTAIQQPLFDALPLDPVGSNEWYTPAYVLEPARRAMGSFDLDPASCEKAQRTVKATRFFDLEDNALERDWSGNVWLNPPYSRGLIEQFVDKLLAEATKSDAQMFRATTIVNMASSTKWFHRLLGGASLVCFVDHRIQFYGPNMSGNGNSYDSLLFYIEAQSKDPATKYRWAAEYSELGKVVQL